MEGYVLHFNDVDFQFSQIFLIFYNSNFFSKTFQFSNLSKLSNEAAENWFIRSTHRSTDKLVRSKFSVIKFYLKNSFQWTACLVTDSSYSMIILWIVDQIHQLNQKLWLPIPFVNQSLNLIIS